MSLLQKLANIQHENHKAVVSALHVHLDVHNCLEVLVLRGRARDVLVMGDELISTHGVRFGKLVPATSGHGLEMKGEAPRWSEAGCGRTPGAPQTSRRSPRRTLNPGII